MIPAIFILPVAFKKAICYTLLTMSALVSALPYIEAGLAILLVISILLQQTGAGLGGALGGGDLGAGHHTRRGAERFHFLSTIVLGIIFAIVALGIFLTS